MRIIQTILLVAIIIGSVTYSGYAYLAGPCRTPLEYSIGRLDEGFKMSESEFLKAIAEAEAIWEKPAERELFSAAVTGDLWIHFIYDERQATADKNETLEAKIGVTESRATIVKREFESLRARHEAAEDEYESLVRAFEARQSAHNANVTYWNGRGGATEGEYKKLSKEASELGVLYESLESKRREVNALAQQVNSLIGEYNRLVKNINSNIEVINESADKEFEQGEYIYNGGEERINIYKFSDRSELVRVLAHELGHALGIEHNTDPESIMYYLNESDTLVATESDMLGLKSACRFD